ncbi:MAG TPA: hypothetical protein DCF68_04420 [Cyanothece sp. UBA12306]|nr:hypothetical protein [Cyanothece sp. UBA12306]
MEISKRKIIVLILITAIIISPGADWVINKIYKNATQKNCRSTQHIIEETRLKNQELPLQETHITIQKNQQIKQNLENYISNLESLIILKDKCNKGSIRWYIEWYDLRYPWYRRVYIVFGMLSLLTPLFFVFFELQDRKTLSVAIVTFIIGITNFFSWGNAWSGFIEAKIQLEFLLHRWEATLIEARANSDGEKAVNIVQTGFNDLLKQSNKVIMEETKSFFDSIKFPST